MKKLILSVIFLAVSPMVIADSSSVKDGVKSVISGVVSSGKDAISGVKDGIEEGRKSGESVDGAIVVFDKDALQKYVAVSVQSVEKIGATDYKLTLVFRNNSDKIVRLTNLSERKSLQLLDKDGFVSYLKYGATPVESDVTIPEKAATRVRYEFSELEGVPGSLRLYGMEISVPEVTAAAK